MIYQDHRDFVFKIVHWYFTGNPLEESRVIRKRLSLCSGTAANASHWGLALT